MGKGEETKPKKKKGRPSLLDLQKRSLKQEHDEQPQTRISHSNPSFKNPIIPNPNPNPNRRFTRRNPISDDIVTATERSDGEEDEEDDESTGKRREKKLKLVLKLPSHQQQRSSVNSTPLISASYGTGSIAEDENDETPPKKRKINAIGDGSGSGDYEKGGKPTVSRATDTLPGNSLESSPTTPLPDTKLLVFILDRIQKKDTYGVFSEPVDPEELPDYHEVIKHPMDFGTVRKKLSGGSYAYLEQFEKDVFLICSNAMRYNAPDTIYFRQARSIQELATKNFENLRQDSEDNETQPKVVRRGRPPTKHLKKPLGRPPFERAGSEFSSDATLATGGDNAIWSNPYDLRRGLLFDKSGPTDVSGRSFHGTRNGEDYISSLGEHKSEWNDEFPGSMLKGMSMKNGKKPFVFDENRRNTYKQSHPSIGVSEPSVFSTFTGERKQLMAVGLHSDHGYARSLARFAANLGPVVWKIASMKIRKALPPGVKFGPGWVGENEAPPPPQQPQRSPLSSSPTQQVPSQQPHSLSQIPSITSTPLMVEPGSNKAVETQEPSNNSVMAGLQSRLLPPHSTATTTSSSTIINRPSEPTTTESVEAVRDSNFESGFSSLKPRPPFQIHQNASYHPTMNGFSGGFGFNVSPQMGKFVRSPQASMPSRIHDMASSKKIPAPFDSEEPMLSASSNGKSSGRALQDSGNEEHATPGTGLDPKPSWRESPLQRRQDSVPPDLNVRFQSPGSPSSSVRVDSPQPDLVLQL